MIAAAQLPSEPGAYALLIEMQTAVTVVLRGVSVRMPPGRYLYCGSAFGYGGIRARVARHLRRRKPAHWHVDQLTRRGRVQAVLAAPYGNECALFAHFSILDGWEVPAPGFGASDCRTCPAHLLRQAFGQLSPDMLPVRQPAYSLIWDEG